MLPIMQFATTQFSRVTPIVSRVTLIASRITLLATIAASAAMAQSWAQPVRDVDREAKSAVHGTCSPLRVAPSYRSSAMQTCSIKPILGNAAAVTRVPEGKVLVIEEHSTACTKASSESFSLLMFGPNGALKTYVPTFIGNGDFGRQNFSQNALTKMYVAPNEPVYGHVSTVNNATAEVNCTIRFQGHFVDLQ